MKKLLLMILICFSLAASDVLTDANMSITPTSEGTEAKLEITNNISLKELKCYKTSKWVITSHETKKQLLLFENRWNKIKKDQKINQSSIKVTSSEGPLNFSIINESDNYKILIEDFKLTLQPNESSYYSFYTETSECIQFRENWSLIRIPIIEGILDSDKGLINHTLSLDKKLGKNEKGYVFLVGLPTNKNHTSYLYLSKSNLVSEDPITVNFESVLVDNIDNKFIGIRAFVDMYYFPNSELKIEQTDIVDLNEEKFSRIAYATNSLNKSAFYLYDQNKINIFYSDDNLVEKSYEIIQSRGKKEILNKPDNKLNLVQESCFPLSNKNLLFPFQCKQIKGDINIFNYLTSEDILFVDMEYLLKFKENDNFIITNADRCISFSEITLPPMQVIVDTYQPPITVQLPSGISNCQRQRIAVTHGGLAQYISPKLIDNKQDFITEENSFLSTNFSINIPHSSVTIEFDTTLKNYSFPKFLFIIYLLYFTWVFFAFSATRKTETNSRNKKHLRNMKGRFIVGIMMEVVGIIGFNPERRIFTLLTLTPLFGFLFGFFGCWICKKFKRT